jgi:O-antigen ligase/polysaccharide polymerase Wzy-like membrane protein/pilin glycosylation ligase PglL
VSLVLAGLAWTVPFLQPYHRFPLTAFYSEWLAFALGLGAAAVLVRREHWKDAALPTVALAPLGLIVLLGIQVALGRVAYPGQALLAGLYLSWAVLLMLLGQVLRREIPLAQIATILAWFLLAGGLLQALVGFAQHFQLAAPPLDVLVARKRLAQIYGNLAQPNHYAACVSLSLASVAYLHACRRLHVAVAAGTAALLLTVLVLAGSRSPWLYLAAFLALGHLLHRSQRSDASRRLAIFAAALVPGLYAAQALASLPFMQPAEGPLVTTADRLFMAATGIELRWPLWVNGWRMFLDAPVLGAGFGQFAWQQFLHRAASGETAAPGLFNHAHNLVLQLMGEFGAVGALAVAGAVLVWIADLRKASFTLERWWLLALLSVIGVHSMLEYPLWYAYFLGVAALLLGLGAERCVAVRHAGAARAAAALLVIAGCVNLVAVISPYRDFERLVFSVAPLSPRAPGEQSFAAAMMRAHREPLLEPYVELAFALGAPIRADGSREQLELNTRVMRLAPVDVVVYRQALLLALAGDRNGALAQLDRALRVHPGEAGTVVSELEELACRHPAEVMPLLELATAKLAPRSAPRGQR